MNNKLTVRLAMTIIALALLSFGFTAKGYAQGTTSAQVATDKSAAGELAFWNRIKDSANIADFKAYMMNFPNGMFFDPAMEKYLAMGGSKSDIPAEVGITDKTSATVQVNAVIKKKLPPAKQVTVPVQKKIVIKPKPLTKKAVVSRKKKPKLHLCPRGMRYFNGSCRGNITHKIQLKKAIYKNQSAPVTGGGGGAGGGGGGAGGGGGGGGGGHWG